MYYVFILDQFTAQIFAEHVQVNNLTQRLASVATSIVRDHQFSTIHLRVLSLVLGLAQFFELRTSPRSSTEYGHSRLKCAQRCAPASRYIVAFISKYVNYVRALYFLNSHGVILKAVETATSTAVFA